MNTPLNHVRCPKCGMEVDDRVPACPQCGEKIYVNVPGDITPTKHPPLDSQDGK
ncbi:zinc ribbon domain-containing protein [Rubripirellula lacrimiformis]|uniref:zinc ribbon domain-containing protein n=1 Tax=Rubripirellula lacrimiformis TaxID=1930273 RepID=UPI0011A96D12|nr:zinc ribbon domain-containing protein [Rubripirellula lacrimiformis]